MLFAIHATRRSKRTLLPRKRSGLAPAPLADNRSFCSGATTRTALFRANYGLYVIYDLHAFSGSLRLNGSIVLAKVIAGSGDIHFFAHRHAEYTTRYHTQFYLLLNVRNVCLTQRSTSWKTSIRFETSSAVMDFAKKTH